MKFSFRKQFLWLRELIRADLKSMLEYRSAFILQIVGMVINDSGFIIVWYMFFRVFKTVNGYGFQDIVGLFGFTTLVYGITFSLTGGIRKISRIITYGQLDKYLALPKNPLVHMAFSEIVISALGDFIFGLVLLIIYVTSSNLSFTSILIIPLLVLFTSMIFTGFVITSQLIVFWIPNSEDLSNTVFELLMGPTVFPNYAFTGKVRLFYIFIIPAIVVSSMPVTILLTLNIKHIFLMGIIAIFWMILPVIIFNLGLKRYESGNLVGMR